jgi:nitrite reductase/ring-hydroxylating ferredoxin subunit/uncharacterized membrane protein
VSLEGIVDVVDEQEWLNELSESFQPAVLKLFSSLGPLKDVLHGVWLGHPLHPAIVDVPIGAWTAALVLDALQMEKAADTAVGIGLAGAVGAAVTGLADWSETSGTGRAQRVGAMHGILNVAATTCYALSLAQRMRGRRKSGVGFSLVGYAIAGASAYLGGHLVFGEQIGVDHTATADSGKPERFTTVLADEKLKEGKPTRVKANSVAILLVRQNGTIHALAETCTHLGGPLAEGELDDEGIRCPWHGSRFCLADGSVLNGPATFRERVFEVRVKDGEIQVRARQQ